MTNDANANANLVAAQARLDAALSAAVALQTNLDRIGMMPSVAADYALDDIDDLLTMVRAKLNRAAAAVDDVIRAATGSAA